MARGEYKPRGARGSAQEVTWDNSLDAFLNAAHDQSFDAHGNPMYYDVAVTTNTEKWIPAMKEEMASLTEHEVWELVDLPEGRQPVKSKWVYWLKRDTDHRPTRYKARLVAKGFSQIHSIDYDETFAPVARHNSF
jgi:Reverse transcriptase (RNA-dependent DNA polymerase)